MIALHLDRTTQWQDVLVAATTVAALALLASVFAYWTWIVLAPAPEVPAPGSLETTTARVAAPALFGLASPADVGATPTTLAITLLGTVAATSGRRGHALVRLGEQPSFVVREGESLAPGITLLEVGADRIVLERAGLRETLAWPQPAAMAPVSVLGANP